MQFNIILLRPLSQNSLENILIKCASYGWIQYSLHQLFPVFFFFFWTLRRLLWQLTIHLFLRPLIISGFFFCFTGFLSHFAFYCSFLSFQTKCQREVCDPLSFSDSSAFPVNLIQMYISEESLWRWLIVYICSWGLSHKLQIMFQLRIWHLHCVFSSMAQV